MLPRRSEDAFSALLRTAYHRSWHGPSPRLLRRVAPTGNCSPSRQLSGSTPSRPILDHDRGSATPSPFRRGVATKPPRQEVAVIGGGITGLTTAYYLANEREDIHVTLYESGKRLGGWIDADIIRVDPGEGEGGSDQVVFQRGPRTLRSAKAASHYDDLVLYDVIDSLGLKDKIRHPKSTSDGRYVYYPDHLVKLPGNTLSLENIVSFVQTFATEPVWDGAIPSLLHYMYKREDEPTLAEVKAHGSMDAFVQHKLENLGSAFDDNEESVGQFIRRLCGDDRLAENLISGMLHGIYGGDIWKLDVKRTIFARAWFNSICRLPKEVEVVRMLDMALMREIMSKDVKGAAPGTNSGVAVLVDLATDWNLIAFDDGLVTLVKALARHLEKRKNVTIKLNEPVTSIKEGGSEVVLVETKGTGKKAPAKYHHVVSTMFSKHLAKVVSPENSLPSLADTHAVTIMVVNLWYPKQDLLRDRHGFGYLVPAGTPDNHECLLGVLFDSDLRTTEDETEPNGTKLTVMLGGHHWDGWSYYPDNDTGIKMAASIVQRHLGVDPDSKVYASARLCHECMPQQYVGHNRRMAAASLELSQQFGGKLSVAGPSYTDVGVMGSMAAGYRAGMGVARGSLLDATWTTHDKKRPFWADRRKDPAFPKEAMRMTGLEQFGLSENPSAPNGGRAVVAKNTLPMRGKTPVETTDVPDTPRALAFRFGKPNFVGKNRLCEPDNDLGVVAFMQKPDRR